MKKLRILTGLIIVFYWGGCAPAGKIENLPGPEIDHSSSIVPDDSHIQLCTEYNKRHYGYDSCLLRDPKIIVIHCTYTRDLAATLKIFRDPVSRARRDILHGGAAPVGTHFIIDTDGTIYSYLPLEYTGRHAVGMNYTAIGIEVQARDNGSLSDLQAEAAASLVKYIKRLRPSIEWVIGHHEYNDPSAPYAVLIRALDPAYRPWPKRDPGEKFMKAVRGRISGE